MKTIKIVEFHKADNEAIDLEASEEEGLSAIFSFVSETELLEEIHLSGFKYKNFSSKKL